MFGHLPFMHMEWSIPGTPKDSERRLNSSDFQLLRDNISADADFLLDGSQSSIQCLPISEYVRNHLLYIQGFSILCSKERYYTIRKNYNSFLLLYTLDGNGILEYEGKTWHIGPSSGFLIDCRKPQYYHTDRDHWTHVDLHFNGPMAEHLLSLYARYGGAYYSDPPGSTLLPSLDQMMTDYTHSIAPYREEQTSCQLQSLILSLIRRKEQQDQSVAVPDSIFYLVKYMENNYRQHLTLDSLSSFACLSKYHLSREFTRFMGVSPIEYLIRIRVQAAEQLLITTNERIADIAEETGFNNLNNFTNQFRKRAGMTPSEYRKKNR